VKQAHSSTPVVFFQITAMPPVHTTVCILYANSLTIPVSRAVSRATTAPDALSRVVSVRMQRVISSQRSAHTAVSSVISHPTVILPVLKTATILSATRPMVFVPRVVWRGTTVPIVVSFVVSVRKQAVISTQLSVSLDVYPDTVEINAQNVSMRTLIWF